MNCSYCNEGLNRRKPLGSPRPRGRLAERIENNPSNGQDQEGDAPVDTNEPSSAATNTLMEEQALDFGDVLNCDLDGGFDLGDEMCAL